jgi:hypothetical protein
METEEARPQSPNASLATILAIHGTNGHSKALLKKFQWAIKQVATEHNHTSDETALTTKELIQLIPTWEPQCNIICLHIFWSHELRQNFHLNLIATLLCLSCQCGYTPLVFLLQSQDCFNSQKQKCSKKIIGLSITLLALVRASNQVMQSPSHNRRNAMSGAIFFADTLC